MIQFNLAKWQAQCNKKRLKRANGEKEPRYSTRAAGRGAMDILAAQKPRKG